MALAVGCAALAWVLHGVGLAAVAQDAARAGWVLPATAGVHLLQLYLSAQAWRASLGTAGIGRAEIFRLRWIREGINALLPVAQIGGQVVTARILTRDGLAPILAVSGTVLDVTLEAAAQLIFTLAGAAILLATRHDGAWTQWAGASLGLMAAGVAALVAAQRLGGLRLVEAAVTRLAAAWPVASGWSANGLHDTLMARQADRAAVARAVCLHTLSWALGGVEVWIALAALHHPVGLVDAAIIEALAMTARSAGFAVPGAVGIQEGGFVVACSLFGVPAEAALALSVLKRLREVLVGIPALIAWHYG